MKKVILKIDGMSCSACSASLEKYLNKQSGIKASVNLVMATASIEYDESKYDLLDIEKFIDDMGFSSLGEESTKKKDYSRKFLIIFLFLLLIFIFIMLNNMFNLIYISFRLNYLIQQHG